jgi:hypothetical protein
MPRARRKSIAANASTSAVHISDPRIGCQRHLAAAPPDSGPCSELSTTVSASAPTRRPPARVAQPADPLALHPVLGGGDPVGAGDAHRPPQDRLHRRVSL